MNTKEAIERVRTRFDKWALDNEDLTALQALGLVTAESEDERIRKGLIEALKTSKTAGELKFILPEPTREECLAYLEKQKDLTTENIYKHSRERMSFWNGQQKEQKPVKSISQLTVQGKGVYKICPRCKERMVRDDSMVYTSMPPQYRYECPKCGESECDTVMYDNPEMEEQKPVVTHGETYHVDTLGTQQVIAGKMPQKPAEWSEEDRRTIDRACVVLRAYANGELPDILPSEILEYADKLQSLRRRLSDEEIKKIRSEEYTKGFNDAAFGGKLKEWSVEDEERIRQIERIAQQAGCTQKLQEEIHDWLKSLRPSWKPSEINPEEVRLLDTTISFLKDFADKGYENAVECIDWLKSKRNGTARK